MRHWRAGIAASASALLLAMSPALAGGLAPGDGSGHDNFDLVHDPALGCDQCAPNVPEEPYDPVFALDWTLGLRGSVATDGTGGDAQYELIALPAATFRHDTARGGYALEISGEIVAPDDGDVRLSSLRAVVTGTYAVDSRTRVEGDASLSLTQDETDDPLVASSSLITTGAVEASVTRDLGLTELTLRGSAGRTVNGETVYVDDSTLDNSFDNTTAYGAGGRFGIKLTPGLTAFLDVEADSEAYDQASPSLLVKLDNVTYAARAGVSSRIGELLEAEASVGYAVRDFADDGVADVSAVLYDASVTYRPDETLTLTGRVATTFGSPGSTDGSSAELTHEVSGDIAYLANSWLRLRGSAGWSDGRFLGTEITERGWRVGFGADYLLNAHTDLTADYSFEHEETSGEPADETHQVMLGVNFHR